MKRPLYAIRLQELVDSIGATLQGDPECVITGLASLEEAGPGHLSFLTSRQYRKFLKLTSASAVILRPEDAQECPVSAVISDNPRLTLAKVARLFEKKENLSPGVHPTTLLGEDTVVAPTASVSAYCVIGKGVTIGAGAVIHPGCILGDGVRIGANSVLKPRVVIYENARIGESCLIHSGVVIGADGFGFANDEDGTWVKMPHLGSVIIGNKVEIGANTTIDRGFLKDTQIGDGVIIDNLVQIGHNVSIGAHTAIAGCVAIAGSTTIGQYCLIGGCATIGGHIEIADRISITATSGVNHSIMTPGVYSSGMPAKPNHIWRKNIARFQTLDEMAKRMRVLENALGIHAEKNDAEKNEKSEKID